MKYKTTYDHPELKQGLEINWDENDEKYYTKHRFWSATPTQMDYQLDQDFVTIVQEPEFTKDGVVDIACKAFDVYQQQECEEHLNFQEVITDLVNQRKK